MDTKMDRSCFTCSWVKDCLLKGKGCGAGMPNWEPSFKAFAKNVSSINDSINEINLLISGLENYAVANSDYFAAEHAKAFGVVLNHLRCESLKLHDFVEKSVELRLREKM